VSFYRPATAEDFTDIEIEYPNNWSMDNYTKQMITQNGIDDAVTYIMHKYGFGVNRSYKYCEAYQAYLFAKEDFESGKPVFVKY